MKKALVALVFLSLSHARAYELSQVTGVYKITSRFVPVTTTVDLKADGSVAVEMASRFKTLKCAGQSTMAADVVSSNVVCDSGRSYIQRINLAGVDISKPSFEAPVYSSFLDTEVRMTLTRVDTATSQN